MLHGGEQRENDETEAWADEIDLEEDDDNNNKKKNNHLKTI